MPIFKHLLLGAFKMRISVMERSQPKKKSLFQAKLFFLGVDSEVQYSLTNFTRAASCVYMVHYIFNINYAPQAQVTLEFIQW